MPEGKIFLDTNILIYAVSENSAKQKKALQLIMEPAIISTQVLGEFVNVCLRKNWFSRKQIIEFADDFISTLDVHPVGIEVFEKALRIMQRYRFHFYDALIISSALQAEASVLYTEDLQHKQKIESLTIINPFV